MFQPKVLNLQQHLKHRTYLSPSSKIPDRAHSIAHRAAAKLSSIRVYLSCPAASTAMARTHARNEPKGDDYVTAYGRDRGTLRAVLTDLLSKCTSALGETECEAYLNSHSRDHG